MTCRYCGTALPEGALFCGECGQPVGSDAAVESDDVAAPTAGFSIADLAFSSPGETSGPDDDQQELPDGIPLDHAHSAEGGAHCPQCGESMARGDVFCGECGFVVRTVSPPVGGNLINLGEFPPDPDATTEVEPLSIADGDAEVDDDPDAGDPSDIDDLVLESSPAFVAPDAEPDPDLEFDDPLPFSEAEADAQADAKPAVKSAAKASPRSRPIPDPFPWGTEQPLREDLEATRLVADSASGTRYVLQFSTGESVTVAGSGLVGRNPSMQPGEYVDQLVPIFDAGKSVSKTHLEFGQEAGRFWVTDRYSTNGSVIRQPDAEARRCDAGRRYFIARGTRVDVGEQFFVVS
jgi:predicted nucleic acid-binding Zn ribbon protein